MASLKRNITLLYLLQGANYLIPLATVPYLSRVLGVDMFGTMGVALSIIAAMRLLTDWGFGFTATQDVAHHAHEPKVLRTIFWDTFWARIGLGLLAFALFGIALATIPAVSAIWPVLLPCLVQVLSSMIAVGWFLQGLEKMDAFVWPYLFARALTIPLTFLLVHTPEDLPYAVFIPGFCEFIYCALAGRMAFKYVDLFPVRFSLHGIKKQIKGGTKLFISTAAINLYTQSNILILKSMASPVQIGYYHASDRVRIAHQAFIGPVSAALFPRINNLMIKDRQAAKKMMLRMLVGQGSFALLVSLAMYFLAPWLVPLALGKEYTGAIEVVQWLSPLPFVIGLNNVLGVNVMIPLGMKNEFAGIVCVSALINFASMILLCPSYGASGAAMSSVLTESFITGTQALILFMRLKGRWPIKRARNRRKAASD